jgi:hypothetical protein
MKTKTAVWICLLLVTVSWALPLYAIVYNQFHPGYESALGVTYGFVLGASLHVVLLFLWIAVRRSQINKAEIILLLTSFCAIVVLAVFSEGGGLSRMNTMDPSVAPEQDLRVNFGSSRVPKAPKSPLSAPPQEQERGGEPGLVHDTGHLPHRHD